MIHFNTANQTFRQLMGNGLQYRIPRFQRDYSWTESEWDDLWQDILALLEGEEDAHYMGYLVLQSKDNKRFEIIDGQQRLTTLSLLMLTGLSHLNALIQGQFDAEKNQIRLQSLRSSYIGYLDPISLVSHSKLSLNRHNDAFYQNYLAPLHPLPQRGLNASEHLLRKAFLWLLERLKQRVGNDEESGKKIAILLDQIVDQLFFTVITVNDELNAFKVFETLNARGVRLSSTDLLKNYLFSLLSHQQDQEAHEIELRAFEARWERIVSLLGANDFSDFLRVYWNSQCEPPATNPVGWWGLQKRMGSVKPEGGRLDSPCLSKTFLTKQRS